VGGGKFFLSVISPHHSEGKFILSGDSPHVSGGKFFLSVISPAHGEGIFIMQKSLFLEGISLFIAMRLFSARKIQMLLFN